MEIAVKPYARLKQKVVLLLQSSRNWVLLSSLATRGSGFALSFSISRVLGVHALGEYSALVNTASSAIQPFVQVTTNNSVLLAHEANFQSATVVRKTAFAGLLVTAGLSAAAFLIYLFLQRLAFHNTVADGYPKWLALVTVGCFVAGQLLGGVLLGCYYGTDRFVTSAKISIAISLVTIIAAVPAIYFSGLAGGYVVFALSSALLPLGLGYGLFRDSAIISRATLFDDVAIKRFVAQFQLSLPSIASAAVAAISSWLCTVYLVKGAFGLEGVGLVAVALQWQTIIMIASSSWNSVSLRNLAQAVRSGDAQAVRAALFGAIRKNLYVTIACSMIVILAADLIARAYGLSHSGVSLLLRLICCSALVLTCNEQFSQLLLCVDRQKEWFLFSAISFLVQIMITIFAVRFGLFVIVLASVAGRLVLLSLCIIYCDHFVLHALRETGKIVEISPEL